MPAETPSGKAAREYKEAIEELKVAGDEEAGEGIVVAGQVIGTQEANEKTGQMLGNAAKAAIEAGRAKVVPFDFEKKQGIVKKK